jgi:hypothetical protein
MALAFSAYYALYAPYPKLLRGELGLSLASMTSYVALFNIGMLLGAVVCGTLAARKGPLWAIVPPALLTLLVLPLYVGHVGSPAWLAVGAFLGGLIGAGYSGVAPLLLTGLFPAAVRARCVGLVYNAGRSSAPQRSSPRSPPCMRRPVMALRSLAIVATLAACAHGVDAGEETAAMPKETSSGKATSAANTTVGAGPTSGSGGAVASSAAAGGSTATSATVAAVTTAGTGGSSGSCDMTSCNACTLCVNSAGCSAEYAGCIGNFQCNAYAGCVQSCLDPSCTQLCQSFYPMGIQPYDAYAACLCSECTTTCSGECA